MAEINLCGHICVFPQVPHATLIQYGVTPRTTELAYKTPNPTVNMMLTCMVQSMYLITALERAPFLVEDGARTIYLLEHPNKQVLETLASWLRWTVGTQFSIIEPYRIAKTIDDEEHTNCWDGLELVKDGNGKRPLVGKHPPARTLPKPHDPYPPDGGAPLTLHQTIMNQLLENA